MPQAQPNPIHNEPPEPQPPANNGWVWPTNTTQLYPTNQFTPGHHAVDVETTSGSKVWSPHDGKVIFAGYNQQGYGNLVVIETANGLRVYLAHLSEIDAKVGDSVKAGQLIGFSGGGANDPGKGNSDGPHLHFEIRSGSAGWVNPLSVFQTLFAPSGPTYAAPGGAPGTVNATLPGPPGGPPTPGGQQPQIPGYTQPFSEGSPGAIIGATSAQLQSLGFDLSQGVFAALAQWVAAFIQSVNWVNVGGFLAGVVLIIIGVVGLVGRDIVGGAVGGAVGEAVGSAEGGE